MTVRQSLINEMTRVAILWQTSKHEFVINKASDDTD
jgi:hypothetical protein